MSDETPTPEDLTKDQDFNLAAIVHNNIAASNEVISIFENSLKDESIDVFSTPREVVEALVVILKTNVKMVTEMFEENSMFHEQARRWEQLRDGGRKNG